MIYNLIYHITNYVMFPLQSHLGRTSSDNLGFLIQLAALP